MSDPVEVGAAIVVRGGRILIARRRPGDTFAGLWEFPGGKVRPGERPSAATRRECAEELGIDVTVQEEVRVIEHEYPGRHVLLHFFRCALAAGEPRAIQCAEWAWVTPDELPRYEFLPADAPLIEELAGGKHLQAAR